MNRLHQATGDVVLAVDADPNANLHAKLGVTPGRTKGDIREELLVEANQLPAGVSKQEHVDYQIRLALTEGVGCPFHRIRRIQSSSGVRFKDRVARW